MGYIHSKYASLVICFSAVTCYHCDIPLMDYKDCFITKTCAKGEVTIKFLFYSGHNNFAMSLKDKKWHYAAHLIGIK